MILGPQKAAQQLQVSVCRVLFGPAHAAIIV
jgi:hypothetical protein